MSAPVRFSLISLMRFAFVRFTDYLKARPCLMFRLNIVALFCWPINLLVWVIRGWWILIPVACLGILIAALGVVAWMPRCKAASFDAQLRRTGQPLNRKRDHQIKRSLLLRIGGTMRKQ